MPGFKIGIQFDTIELMNDLTKNILTVGIPYLNKISDWESAADYFFNEGLWRHAAKIFDFYILVDQPYMAEETQKIIENYFKELDPNDVPSKRFEEIKIRKDYLLNRI